MTVQDPTDDKYLKVLDVRGQSGYVPRSCLRVKNEINTPLETPLPQTPEESTPLPEPTEDLDDATIASVRLQSVKSVKSAANTPAGTPLSQNPEEDIPLPEPTEDLDDAAIASVRSQSVRSVKSAAKSVINSPVGTPLSQNPEEESTSLPEPTTDLDDAAPEGEGVTIVVVFIIVVARGENEVQHACTESKQSSEIRGFDV